jgi:hypothetical protein
VSVPTWVFERGPHRLELRRHEAGGEAVLTIVDGEGPRAYRFGSMVALTNFQCDMEEMLLKTGWSFVHFSPEHRTGQERRRSPRVLGDRRRWWTDDPALMPRRSRSRDA